MSAPFVTFPGLTTGEAVSFYGELGNGIRPGRFVIKCDREAAVATHGTLTFGDGELGTVTVPGCKRTAARWSGTTYVIEIEDRRWRWEYGAVFGDYNEPIDDSESVRRSTSPATLAALLWAEMNETALTTTNLPTGARPRADWYADNPASELENLLATIGCVLSPQLDGSWACYQIGQGSLYTATSYLMSNSFAQDIADYPDQAAVICGASRYEVVFELEAVGEGQYGQLEPIDDLEYVPEDGWINESNSFANVTGTYDRDGRTLNNRDLARGSVRRWYRIKSIPSGDGAGNLNPPGWEGPDIVSKWQLLPLIDAVNRVETRTSQPNWGKRATSSVWGEFLLDKATGEQSRPGAPVAESFSIDADRGLVKFSQPIYRVEDGFYQPAKLFLQCTVMPPLSTGKPAFHAKYVNSGLNNGTGAEVVLREDLAYETRPNWSEDGTLADSDPLPSNLTALSAQLDNELNAASSRFVTQPGGTMLYSGIHSPQLNGLQTSVAWSFGTNQAPTTTIGVSNETNPYRPTLAAVRRDRLALANSLRKRGVTEKNLRRRGLA